MVQITTLDTGLGVMLVARYRGQETNVHGQRKGVDAGCEM